MTPFALGFTLGVLACAYLAGSCWLWLVGATWRDLWEAWR